MMKSKQMIWLTVALCLVGGLFLMNTFASVEAGIPYTMSRWRVGNGGASLTNGAYTLHATVGQTEAGTLAAEPFTLHGGFWQPDTFDAPSDDDNTIYLPVVIRP